MPDRFAGTLLITGLLLAAPAAAQQGPVSPPQDSTTVGRLRPSPEAARLPPLHRSSAVGAGPASTLTLGLRRDAPPMSRRGKHALIGGFIGAATGLIVCTTISNLVNDPGTGFSTCTAKGYVLFGVGGLAVGALIGSRID
jgi:hypothetical protein